MRLKQYLTESPIKVDSSWFRTKLFELEHLIVGNDPVIIVNFLRNKFFGNNFVFMLQPVPGRSDIEGTTWGDLNDKKTPQIDFIIPYSVLNNLTSHNYKKFVDEMTQIYEHEMVHRGQYNLAFPSWASTEGETTEDYYGNKQEVMAFAKHIEAELRLQGLDKHEIIDLLKKGTKGKSFILDKYVRLFKGKDPKILNRLFTIIIKYLD